MHWDLVYKYKLLKCKCSKKKKKKKNFVLYIKWNAALNPGIGFDSKLSQLNVDNLHHLAPRIIHAFGSNVFTGLPHT
jgi:hypothetical protein